MYSSTAGLMLSRRTIPPSHYTLKIKSFSVLSELLRLHGKHSYESGIFVVGGYRWKLSLYPEGDKKSNGDGYISLYLLLLPEEVNKINSGFEIKAIITFFVYDHIRDNYLTIQDDEGMVRSFHTRKREHGFSQLIRQSTFQSNTNGYLVEDCCELGVEVFVLQKRSKGECLAVLRESNDDNWHCTLTVPNFSELGRQYNSSKEFSFGGRNWKLDIYSEADPISKKDYLCLFLDMIDYPNNTLINMVHSLRRHLTMMNDKEEKKKKESPKCDELYVEWTIQVVDQKHGNHKQIKCKSKFNKPDKSWGFNKFMLLSVLHDPSKGYLLDDALIVRVKFGNTFAAKHAFVSVI